MRVYTSLLLTFVALDIYGQSIDNTNTSGLYFGISISPDICYRTLRAERIRPSYFPVEATELHVNSRNINETIKYGHTAGIDIKWKPINRIGLFISAYYSEKGERSVKIDPFNPLHDISPIPLEFWNTNWKWIKYNSHFRYLDLPLTMQYFLLMDKTSLFISGGVSTGVLLDKKRTTTVGYFDGSQEPYRDFSLKGEINARYYGINFSLLAGLGISRMIGKRTTFRFQPVFRHSIIAFNASNYIKQYHYSFGTEIGLMYKILPSRVS